jgi:hypothetical protein
MPTITFSPQLVSWQKEQGCVERSRLQRKTGQQEKDDNGVPPTHQGVLMSDCLHCDIHEMLESHLKSEQADLSEIAAKVTEVLADLIMMAPPDEQTVLMAHVLANLGGMVFEKSQEPDPTNPGHSRH